MHGSAILSVPNVKPNVSDKLHSAHLSLRTSVMTDENYSAMLLWTICVLIRLWYCGAYTASRVVWSLIIGYSAPMTRASSHKTVAVAPPACSRWTFQTWLTN